MSYQMTFLSAASAEPTHLLQAVERHLNGAGIYLQAQTFCERWPVICWLTGIGPHESPVALTFERGFHTGLIVGAIVALVVGSGVGYLLSIRSKRATNQN